MIELNKQEEEKENISARDRQEKRNRSNWKAFISGK